MSAANDNSVPRCVSLGLGAAADWCTVNAPTVAAVAPIVTRVDAGKGRIDVRGGVVVGGDHATGVNLRIGPASSGKLRSVTGRPALFAVPVPRGQIVDRLA